MLFKVVQQWLNKFEGYGDNEYKVSEQVKYLKHGDKVVIGGKITGIGSVPAFNIDNVDDPAVRKSVSFSNDKIDEQYDDLDSCTIKGEMGTTVIIDDSVGEVSMMLVPQLSEKYEEILEKGNIILAKGFVYELARNLRNEKYVLCNEISLLDAEEVRDAK